MSSNTATGVPGQRSAGALISEAFTVWTHNIGRLALVGFPALLVMALLQLAIFGPMAGMSSELSNVTPASPEYSTIVGRTFGKMVGLWLLLVIPILFASAAYECAVLVGIEEGYFSKATALGAVYRRVATRLLANVGRLLLISLIFIVLYIAVLVVLGVVGLILTVVAGAAFSASFRGAGTGSASAAGLAGAGLAFLAFILLAISGILAAVIYVFTRLSMSGPALVLEQAGPLEAISRSLQLTRHRFWRCLGVLFVAALPYVGVSMVLGIVAGIVGLVAGRSPLTQLLPVAVGPVVSLFVYPVVFAAQVALYYEARRHESGVLSQAAPPVTDPAL